VYLVFEKNYITNGKLYKKRFEKKKFETKKCFSLKTERKKESKKIVKSS
jgi:hypothetical protein